MWKRRRRPEPDHLGELTLWEGVDDDGDEQVLWAELTTDPKMSESVEQVKKTLREHGWTQLAGD